MPEHSGSSNGHHHHEPEDPMPEGWSRPLPEHYPQPTYWPAVMGLGITFLFWGVVTSYLITLVGLVLFGISLAGWIGELIDGD